MGEAALVGLVVTLPMLLAAQADGPPPPRPPAAARPAPDSVLRLIDLDGLADLEPGVSCRQFSSSDPAGRGDDHGHFLALEGKRATLAEMDGPGVVTRLWSANAAGRLKVYVDGEAAPRIDCPFQDLFTGKVAPFVPPIAIHAGGGWISYFPIAYQKHCRIDVDELDDPHTLYYQVQYKSHPAGTKLRSFTRELPAEEQSALAQVVKVWRDPEHEPPQPPVNAELRANARGRGEIGSDATHAADDGTEVRSFRQPAGVGLPTIDSDGHVPGAWGKVGAGVIDFLRVDVADPTLEKLRGLVLELWFDGAREPSVSVPLADLFGVGFGPRPQAGLLLGWGEHGGYCRLPMPFSNGFSLSLTNLSKQEVSGYVEYRVRRDVPIAAGRFHAEYRRSDPVGAELYEFCRATDAGKFVGVNLTLQGVGDLWYLEGNEQFFVDGETKPSILGTGTEDFFNGGWYWDSGPLTQPLHGLGVKEEWTTNRTTPWRHFLNDAVPFEKSLAAKIEHGSSNEVLDASYSSVAFWYGESPHPVRRADADTCRLPRRWVRRPKDALAAVALRWSRGSHIATKFESVSSDFRGCEYRLFQAFPVSHFERDHPRVEPEFALLRGDEASAIFPVEVGDRYRLRLGFAADLDAPPVEVLVDDKTIGTRGIVEARVAGDGMAPANPEPLGPIGLAAGTHVLTLRWKEAASNDRERLGLDSLTLEPASEFVKAWWVAPPVECRPKSGAAAEDSAATVALEPEEEAAFLKESFDPKAAGWKEIAHDSGELDLNGLVTPKAPIFAYLLTWIRSPDRRTTTVRLGSDDGVRVWLDGKVAFTHAIHRPLAIDADRFDLTLEPGWHALLVKVKNDDGGFGLALRLCDPDGSLKCATRRE